MWKEGRIGDGGLQPLVADEKPNGCAGLGVRFLDVAHGDRAIYRRSESARGDAADLAAVDILNDRAFARWLTAVGLDADAPARRPLGDLLCDPRVSGKPALDATARSLGEPTGPQTSQPHDALVVPLRTHGQALQADGAPVPTVVAGNAGHALYWHVVHNGAYSGLLNELPAVIPNPGVDNVHIHVVVSGDSFSATVNGQTTTLVDSTIKEGRVGLYDFYGPQTFSTPVLLGINATVVPALTSRSSDGITTAAFSR